MAVPDTAIHVSRPKNRGLTTPRHVDIRVKPGHDDYWVDLAR